MEEAKERRKKDLHDRGLLQKKDISNNGAIGALNSRRTEMAEARLRNFAVCSEFDNELERDKLIKYFSSRYVSYVRLMRKYTNERL